MTAGALGETKPLKAATEEAAKQLPAGGMVLAERVGDKVEYSAAGRLEPQGTTPEAVVFEIGSISKVFTALLLAQATVEGKVTLETTVAELMGPAQRFDDPRVGAITLRQLATHTSGLPRLPADLWLGADPNDPYAHYDRARLNAGVQITKLESDGPFPMSYSNFGLGLLGDLLARRYGKTWAELIAEKITGPLKMADTVVELSAEQQARLAPPYAGPKPNHAWHLNAFVGAGGLRSTAADLMKFGEALLAPEKSPLAEAIALLLRPQTKSGDIGLAIMISKFAGEIAYEHDGGTGGYRSQLRVTPARHTVTVVLVNNAAGDPARVFSLARNEKPRLKESDKVMTETQLAGYEGVYRMDHEHVFTILRRGGELWARLTGQPFFRLFPHEQDDRFFLKVVAAEIQFHRTGEAITGLTLHQNGREVPATRKEEPVPKLLFPTPPELQAYVGTYALAPGATFKLTVASDTLYAQLTGQPALPVFATGHDRFVYDVVKAELEFERTPDGKVQALILHQNGQSPRARKEP
jgi:CubicO group peptidase (beta-lactamase class C family)